MKLRRALATAAATAVIAPLALLSAPAAFANDTPSTSADAGSTATDDQTTPADDTPTDEQSTPSEDETKPSDDEGTQSDEETKPSDDENTQSDEETKPSDDEPWNPYEECESFNLDDKLTASISGLPNRIVAGSGWHEFTFVVNNGSDKDLKKVWVEAFAEYADDTNADSSLSFDLAELQYKQDGKWTSSYQDYNEDEDGKTSFTGTFVAVLDSLEKHSTATLDLRVQVKASAPAGSSFALSQAVYAGKDSACYGNGDFYDFTVLAAGTKPSDNVDDAKPNGKKPKVTDGTKPQGEVKEITGNLAETGSSSALPTVGLAGGVALVAGAGAVFVVRRRKAGADA